MEGKLCVMMNKVLI